MPKTRGVRTWSDDRAKGKVAQHANGMYPTGRRINAYVGTHIISLPEERPWKFENDREKDWNKGRGWEESALGGKGLMRPKIAIRNPDSTIRNVPSVCKSQLKNSNSRKRNLFKNYNLYLLISWKAHRFPVSRTTWHAIQLIEIITPRS